MDNNLSLTKYLDSYDNNPEVLQEIIQEKEAYQNQNLATQAKYGEILIINNKKLKAFGNDVILALGESEIEIEEEKQKNKHLTAENHYLKKTLDKNHVIYEDGLKELVNNNDRSLIIKTNQEKKQRGFDKLMRIAKQNRKL